jgi:hypothetical protein
MMWTGFMWFRIRTSCGNEPKVSVKVWYFLDQLSHCQLFKRSMGWVWSVDEDGIHISTNWKCYCDLFFGLHPSSLCFSTTTFRGMALLSSSREPTLLGPVDRASLNRWTLSKTKQPTKKITKGGVLRKRQTSSLARFDHSCVRNAFPEMVKGALKL